MSMANFYVSPETFMRDKADYARRNIARGRPLIGATYDGGIVIAAENTSTSLHKISEIYDRIAFAGVGKYNEFEQLRRAGVQHADVKGYQFSREDVEARSLANIYAQYVGNVFIHDMKPLEAEILVAEVGPTPADDRMFHILYDGAVVDEKDYSVLGGEVDVIVDRMKESYQDGWGLADALKASVKALAGDDRTIEASELEVAILDRTNTRRAFRRIEDEEAAQLLG
jgi:proteasome alpha subunit